MLDIIFNPYLINIFLLIFSGLIIFGNKKIKNSKKLFIIISSFQWILLAGLRHYSIGGPDVYITYYSSFNESLITPWSQVIFEFSQIFTDFKNFGEPGYLLFEKLIGFFSSSYQFYLFALAVVFMAPFGVFVYKYSKNPLMSFLIYSTLFYSFFSLTGFRQTLATTLIVLVGYDFIIKKKFISFLILSFIAFTIHKSSIVFFPFYFLANIKINLQSIIAYLILIIVLFFFGESIYYPVAVFLGYEGMIENEIGGTLTFTLMMIFVGIVSVWRYKQVRRLDINSNSMYIAVLIGILLSVLTLQNQSFMRVQQYYSIFIILLIPNLIRSFKPSERLVVSLVSVSVLLLLFLQNNPQYLFFWERVII